MMAPDFPDRAGRPPGGFRDGQGWPQHQENTNMAFNWSGVTSGLGSVYNTLVSAGLTPANAASTAATIFGSSVGQQEKPILLNIVSNYQTPAVVQDLVTKALEIQNVPGSVSSLLAQLPALAAAAAANPGASLGNFMGVVGAIEKELGI